MLPESLVFQRRLLIQAFYPSLPDLPEKCFYIFVRKDNDPGNAVHLIVSAYVTISTVYEEWVLVNREGLVALVENMSAMERGTAFSSGFVSNEIDGLISEGKIIEAYDGMLAFKHEFVTEVMDAGSLMFR